MLIFSVLGLLVVVPVFAALDHTRSALAALALILLALTILSVYTSIAGIVKAEMFPPQVRALGVGVSYALGNALFGGTAEYIALALKQRGHAAVYPWYVTLVMASVLVVSWHLPRVAKHLQHE